MAKRFRRPVSTVATNQISSAPSQIMNTVVKKRRRVRPNSSRYRSMRCSADAPITNTSATWTVARMRKSFVPCSLFTSQSSSSSIGITSATTHTSSKNPRRAYCASSAGAPPKK